MAGWVGQGGWKEQETIFDNRDKGLEKKQMNGSMRMDTKCGSLRFRSVPTRPSTMRSYTERLIPWMPVSLCPQAQQHLQNRSTNGVVLKVMHRTIAWAPY